MNQLYIKQYLAIFMEQLYIKAFLECQNITAFILEDFQTINIFSNKDTNVYLGE